jgi:hypothetical protein
VVTGYRDTNCLFVDSTGPISINSTSCLALDHRNSIYLAVCSTNGKTLAPGYNWVVER